MMNNNGKSEPEINSPEKQANKTAPRVIDFEKRNKELGIQLNKPSANPIKENKSFEAIEQNKVNINFGEEYKGLINDLAGRDAKKDLEDFKELGMVASEIFSGEYINERSQADVITSGDYSCSSFIALTNYRLLILPINSKFMRVAKLNSDFFRVPFSFLDRIVKIQDKKQINNILIEIQTKDCREFKLKFTIDANKLISSLQSKLNFMNPESYSLQFSYFLKPLDIQNLGWNLYSIEDELIRQGFILQGNNLIFEGNNLFKIIDNTNGRICSTYPEKLIVPTKIIDDFITKSANFRARERIPTLCYFYNKNGKIKSFLWRCSQCKPGLTDQRSLEDESLVRAIRGESESNLKIFDARPFLNAAANKFVGKGYENANYYQNTDLKFLGIPNIQKVQQAYKKIRSSAISDDKIDSNDWMDYLSKILAGANELAKNLNEGNNVLLHCSDGWDRTSQLSALSQIILDPFYRTFTGFIILIEKEWLSFGHQFSLRCGHTKYNVIEDQKSPIFLQFLDCIHQLMIQYPLSFEFNLKLLTEIGFHCYSCFFGNFLLDCIKDRKNVSLSDHTVSIWSYLIENKSSYLNPFYKNNKKIDQQEIFPSSTAKCLRIWKEYFLQYNSEVEDKYKKHVQAKFPEDNLSIEFFYLLEENIMLRDVNSKINNAKNE